MCFSLSPASTSVVISTRSEGVAFPLSRFPESGERKSARLLLLLVLTQAAAHAHENTLAAIHHPLNMPSVSPARPTNGAVEHIETEVDVLVIGTHAVLRPLRLSVLISLVCTQQAPVQPVVWRPLLSLVTLIAASLSE